MVIYSGFSHWKWWFSIAMLVYQRVTSWLDIPRYHCFTIPSHQVTVPPSEPSLLGKTPSRHGASGDLHSRPHKAVHPTWYIARRKPMCIYIYTVYIETITYIYIHVYYVYSRTTILMCIILYIYIKPCVAKDISYKQLESSMTITHLLTRLHPKYPMVLLSCGKPPKRQQQWLWVCHLQDAFNIYRGRWHDLHSWYLMGKVDVS